MDSNQSGLAMTPVALAIRKLDTVVTTEAPYKGELEAGHHVVTLTYKTDEATKIKKPSESWIVPFLPLPAGVSEVPTGPADKEGKPTLSATQKALRKLVNRLQKDQLTELAAGDLEARKLVGDLEALLVDWTTDARGERKGPKQSALNDWIVYVLVPYMAARIKANLAHQTEAQRIELLARYSKAFKIAATTGNRLGNETISDAGLQDLQQRLVTYTISEDVEKNLPKSEALDAIMARIDTHRSAIAKAAAEITNDTF